MTRPEGVEGGSKNWDAAWHARSHPPGSKPIHVTTTPCFVARHSQALAQWLFEAMQQRYRVPLRVS